MVQSGDNDLGRFTLHSSSWTTEGIKCFQRNCVCEGCEHEAGFYKTLTAHKRSLCQMKASVLEMVRRFGIPPNVKTRQFLEE